MNVKGISKKEMKVIANLEFEQRYFFTSGDIDRFAKNKTQRYNIIKNLVKKKRIAKLNRRKYYLIPVKARSGTWSEHPFVIIDEVCDSKDYFIGGWSAANYWRLTDQIPMWHEVYTTKRQGKARILNIGIIFRRTTKKRIREAITESIGGHAFKMLNRRESKKWIKSRD